MGSSMRCALRELLCVKSMVTLLLTLIFGHMTAVGQVDSQDFLTIFSVVIAFYFGSQTQGRTPDNNP